MRYGQCAQKHPGQNKGAFEAAQQRHERRTDYHRQHELEEDHAAAELGYCRKHRPPIGDHLNGADDPQPPGGAEEATDHRIWHETDRAPGTREAKDT